MKTFFNILSPSSLLDFVECCGDSYLMFPLDGPWFSLQIRSLIWSPKSFEFFAFERNSLGVWVGISETEMLCKNTQARGVKESLLCLVRETTNVLSGSGLLHIVAYSSGSKPKNYETKRNLEL